MPHVLIVVQNLPVPLDRRVWLECQALRAAGYQVSVICPKGPGDPGYEEIDGVRIWKYRPAPATSGSLSYLYEFVYCWLRTAWLSLRVWRRGRFDVLQACNPPDTYWALALLYKGFGVRFVYDQHDLNPEVYLSRFGSPTGAVGRLQFAVLRWLERRTYRTADQVISTNESYRTIALTRGGRHPADVTVVRSGPDTNVMRPVVGLPELRRGRRYLAAYLGIMGPQDGVERVIDALDILVHRMGRRDVQVALLGFGDCLDDLVARAQRLGLAEYVTFTGRADQRMILEYLSTSDIGLSPDPKSPLNDVSTMNKTMEYMAFAVPVVAFDLVETRVSAGPCAVYVDSSGDAADETDRFAKAVADLLDDEERRVTMGVSARRRAVAELDWQPQRARYVGVFDSLTGHRSELPETVVDGTTQRYGRRLVDATSPEALAAHIRDRCAG
jgi:glycosyltransferase involved in cell wall biosynthesis